MKKKAQLHTTHGQLYRVDYYLLQIIYTRLLLCYYPCKRKLIVDKISNESMKTQSGSHRKRHVFDI